ncbi:UDP-galactopyranose mutase [Adlercreutzia equolifaciens]|uniref:UDP-galactopyranose mutase n=1 Tax=Adlercreutzia equolifaciens TaxID=446660 RepID=UPI0023B0E866|nr:UDP-galactopyranose mutase [Adlercreutzia equolifaciens]MDE8703147.1 UDP-galactopyranose mutase [Adlercreutzia equolifaciens]
MAVNYANFREIDIADYDAVVVGSGFAGAVTARELAEQGGMNVLVIEKRGHIAGNMYDEYDEAGILVHRYGPHIFHTNSQEAYEYLKRFSAMSSYQHCVLADWFGTYMPVPFNKNSMEIAFGDEKAARLIKKLVDTFGDERKVTINELRAQEDPDLQEVADFIYQNVFLYYTQKQWGLTPEEVDPSVTARVPVFLSRDNRYFQDTYQGMPEDGYTKLFENMLGHEGITVCLNTEAESVFDLVFASREEDAPLEAIRIKDQEFDGPIVYTGPLDELFLGRFGRLPYRSLDFVYETFDEDYHLPCGTVNYTVTEDYTRITEFKWLTGQRGDKTTIMKEYSRAYEDPSTQIPYYAIINDDNDALYERYRRLTDELPNFHPLGRLAEYRYFNMDKVIVDALAASKRILALADGLDPEAVDAVSGATTAAAKGE